jgi:hydrogenase maturation protein HypF
LAVGAHLKNTVALSVGNQVFISQHIGDLETEPANHAFRRVIADFEKLYEAQTGNHRRRFASGLSLDPFRGRLERRAGQAAARPGRAANASLPRLASNTTSPTFCPAWRKMKLSPPALGVSWDGTGYGLDGTVWGGEFFLVTDKNIERVAHLRPFRLPGGDKAVKEPRRAALGCFMKCLATRF